MTISCVQKNFLSELLPYETSNKIKAGLRAGLKEYSLLLEATKLTMRAIQDGDLEQFDALVGENACQIRAAKIAMLFPRYLDSSKSIQDQVKMAQQKIENLSKSLNSLMGSRISLQTLLQEQAIDIPLTTDELFLIKSFLLSLAKTETLAKTASPLCRNGVADPKKLKQLEKEVSTSFTNNLVKKIRQLLSTVSVDFVREQARFLNDRQLEDMCSSRFTINHNSWPCIPMFWTYKTLLLAAQKIGIPLVLCARFLAKDLKYLRCS